MWDERTATPLPSPHFAWLLRPLIDLGDFEAGPFYSRAVEFHWQAIEDLDSRPFGLQRILPAGFREALVHEARRPDLAVGRPQALKPEARTPRWAELCARLDAWPDLPSALRCRLVHLLHAMGWYDHIVDLLPAFDPRSPLDDPDRIDLAYWRASARYMLDMPARIEDYGDADLQPFFAIAADAAGVAPKSAFNAAVKVFVHGAKANAPVAELEQRAQVLRQRIGAVQAHLPEFEARLLTSRFHRALAYLPMTRGRHDEMSREMQRSEDIARNLEPVSPAERLLALENLHPVLESRVKEAELRSQWDLALARAREVVALDPHDPKSWLELGAVLMRVGRPDEAAAAAAAAARLGPPVSAVAHYMTGLYLGRAGQPQLAAYFFQQSLQLDPLGLSPRTAIQELADTDGFVELKDWSSRRLEASP